ncbi:MAG: hypothetical protein GY832_21445 [Chloroflexi bacterium]|nr:hypothetical protein [Chloroflexota bacterium]
MIMFPMLILVIVPLVAGIESLFAKKENARAISILAGLCVGGFLWNVYSDWRVSPIRVTVLAILAIVPIIRLFRIGTKALKQGLIAAVVTFVVLLVAWQGLLSFMVNVEVVSDIEILNPDASAGTALVVYHPGRSGYQEMANQAFAEGLISNGWRVEITTASKETPTDLSGYDLLVLSAPTYDWVPAKPIQRYLEQLGDLEGQPTAVIISAAGTTTLAVPMMEEMVKEANGDLVGSYTLWTLIPNQLRYGINDAEEIMRQEAKAIPLPGE